MKTLAAHLDRYRTAEFSLDELSAAAGRLLRLLALRPDDGRVAGVPDERAIRFYQTTGLVDRPARYDGRRAVYGFQHLLQLLAVKRLQQEGQPLALIQRALSGRSTDELERAVGGLGAEPATAELPAPRPSAEAVVPPARPLLAVELQPGVTLTIDPARVPDADALAARIGETLAGIRHGRNGGQ